MQMKRMEGRPAYVLMRRRLKGTFQGWQLMGMAQKAKEHLRAVADRHRSKRLKALAIATWYLSSPLVPLFTWSLPPLLVL